MLESYRFVCGMLKTPNIEKLDKEDGPFKGGIYLEINQQLEKTILTPNLLIWSITSGDFTYQIFFKNNRIVASSFKIGDYIHLNNEGELEHGGEFSVTVNGTLLIGLDSFIFEGYEIIEESNSSKRLVISLVNHTHKIRIKTNYISYGSTGIIGRFQGIENIADLIYQIDGISSYQFVLPSSRFKLHSLSGSWSQEFKHNNEVLTLGKKTLEARSGRSSDTYSPWYAIEDMRRGLTIVGQIAWSGNWKATFDVSHTGSLVIETGINDWNFQHALNPGQLITTPLSVFGVV